MMELVSRKFKLEGNSWFSGNIYLCNLEFDEWFYIPESVKTIWLSLHDRSAANRYSMEVKSGNDYPNDYPVLNWENEWDIGVGCFDKILKPLIGETVYVQCEYEI